MSKNLVNKVGESGQDNLIARLFPRALTTGIKVAAGEGVLKRGTILAAQEDGTCIAYGKIAVADGEDGDTQETTPATPSYILADDVDASGDEAISAVAYRSGNFNANAVIVNKGYILTAADKDALRKYDIVLTNMMED